MAIVQSAQPTTNLLMIVTRRMILEELVTEKNLFRMQIRDCKRERGESLFFGFNQFLKFSNSTGILLA